MAGEIQADHTTAKTVYAQVRNSIGQIWNTVAAAFQAYATANIADYDIALVEQGTGSGLYAGNMPAVAAGIYNIVVKERAGGAPAESDVTIGEGELRWTGTAVVNIEADMVRVSGGAAAADSFETMLDGTGGSVLSLGQLVVTNPVSGAAVMLRGGGAGAGLDIAGGATGPGIKTSGGATSGKGLQAIGTGNNAGSSFEGGGTGAGFAAVKGGSGTKDIDADETDRMLGLQGKFVGVRNVAHDGNGDLLTMDIIVYDTLANAATNDGVTGLLFKYSVINTYSAAGRLATSVTTQVT